MPLLFAIVQSEETADSGKLYPTVLGKKYSMELKFCYKNRKAKYLKK